MKNMIKKFKIFEEIRWWINNELSEDDGEDFEEIINDEINIFKNFLINNDSYYSFLNNISHRYDMSINDINFREFILNNYKSTPSNYIDYLLTWSDTREGSEYWSDMNEKWKIFCEKQNLK